METKALRLISVALLLAVVVTVLFACFASTKAPTFKESYALLEDGYYFGNSRGRVSEFLYFQYEEKNTFGQVFRWGTNPYQISFEKGIKYPVQKGYGNSTEAYLSIEEHSVLDIVTQLWSTKELYGTRYYFDGKKLCFMDVDKCYDVVDVKVLDSQVEAKIRYQELSSKFNYTLELILTEEAYENGLTNVYIILSGYKYLFTSFSGDENSDWYYHVDERFGLNIDQMEMFLEFEHKLPLRYEHDDADRKINVWFMCEGGERDFPVVWFDPEIGK